MYKLGSTIERGDVRDIEELGRKCKRYQNEYFKINALLFEDDGLIMKYLRVILVNNKKKS